jgi:hypothetical protein
VHVTEWDGTPGRAAEEQADQTDDAIDEASRDVDPEAERAAQRSGYADRASGDEVDGT